MARSKKSLGEFRVGAYVRCSADIFYYGKVIEIDLKRSVVVWEVLDEEGSRYETSYPPGDAFVVVDKKDIPRSWL